MPIKKHLEDNNKFLYHVTDISNINSILENGLLSLSLLSETRITPKYISSPRSRIIDNERGIDKYVRLSYTYLYDMIAIKVVYGELNPAIIKIKPTILNNTNIFFTTKNAISNDAIFYSLQSNVIKRLRFDLIEEGRTSKNYNIEKYKNARQSEVLILNNIALSYIEEIIVPLGRSKTLNIPEGIKIKEDNTFNYFKF